MAGRPYPPARQALIHSTPEECEELAQQLCVTASAFRDRKNPRSIEVLTAFLRWRKEGTRLTVMNENIRLANELLRRQGCGRVGPARFTGALDGPLSTGWHERGVKEKTTSNTRPTRNWPAKAA